MQIGKKHILLLLLLLVGVLTGTEYRVLESRISTIKFSSQAPFDSVVGISNNIYGHITWSEENYLDSSGFYFEVPLETIDTGINLRNRHMREEYLETDLYPIASISGRLTEVIENEKSVSRVEGKGEMTIHGITNPLQFTGSIIAETEDIYLLKTSFFILLTDYDIEVPRIMFLRIANRIDLELTIYVKKNDGNSS